MEGTTALTFQDVLRGSQGACSGDLRTVQDMQPGPPAHKQGCTRRQKRMLTVACTRHPGTGSEQMRAGVGGDRSPPTGVSRWAGPSGKGLCLQRPILGTLDKWVGRLKPSGFCRGVTRPLSWEGLGLQGQPYRSLRRGTSPAGQGGGCTGSWSPRSGGLGSLQPIC